MLRRVRSALEWHRDGIRIDALAVSSLSGESLGRYYAFKQTLLDLEQDDKSVISRYTSRTSARAVPRARLTS
jgi:hypothetical protein